MHKNKETLCFFVFLCFHKQTKQTLEVLSFIWSLAEKQLKVCELIEKFSIGTIVLDEIQLINFNSNKENSYEGLLGIVNKTKIALSVVGTDEAYKKLFGMLRNARRAGEYINASAYTSDKEYFNYLLSMLLT